MMIWEGEKIKVLAKKHKISIKKLAERLDVSKQTVNDWIKGLVPKGSYLIEICKLFNINADYFFSNQTSNFISIFLHVNGHIIANCRKCGKFTENEFMSPVTDCKRVSLCEDCFRDFMEESNFPELRQSTRYIDTERQGDYVIYIFGWFRYVVPLKTVEEWRRKYVNGVN